MSDSLTVLAAEFDWLSEVIQRRFSSYFQPESRHEDVYDLEPPQVDPNAEYAKLLNQINNAIAPGEAWLARAHRILILLALAPHLKPSILDVFFTRNTIYDRGFTEFGGVSSKQHGGFLPTGETAMFLLCGGDIGRRGQLRMLFDESYFLATENIIHLRGQQANEPFLSGLLIFSEEYLTRLTTGGDYAPRYGSHFPARRLTTSLTWDDLVLPPHLLDSLEEVAIWMKHEQTIMSDMGLGKFIKPGYRALFYGPPGTGKTLCATLLGKGKPLGKTTDKAAPERPVYRIDLSQVVSKYIGETEKNLAGLFAKAEHKNWILFFDEADALFGKRTTTKGGNDRYANQEIAYLLQRIETYDGIVILASNLKGNIDEAFARRFQAMLYFPIPGPEQRRQLWENTFSEKLALSDDIDFAAIARDYELSGGAIVNVVRYCALAVLGRKERKEQEGVMSDSADSSLVVQLKDIQEGIRREMRKSGKTG